MSNLTMSYAIVIGTFGTVMGWASGAVSGNSHYSPLAIVLIIIGIVGLVATFGELIVYQVAKRRELHSMITEMGKSEQNVSTKEHSLQ